MQQLPLYVSILFGLTTLLTVFLFYKAAGDREYILWILFGWLAIQGLVSYRLYYLQVKSLPPRMLWLIGPPLLLIILLFSTTWGRRFVDGLQLKWLTLLHLVRVPVEVVLYLLFIHGRVPEIMTFEGNNFDVFSGLTAPVVFYFGVIKKKLSNKLLLGWNLVCLLLLFNIVITAMLSAPSPFQRLGFEQPNIAVFHFPFSWLPCCIVPLVLLSHVAAIRQLLAVNKTNSIPGKQAGKKP